jgi:hypothetical protein
MDTKHTGGCHCGAVRYEVRAPITDVISCNCSICSKKGALLTFVPADQFTLLEGEDSLREYRFNKQIIQHLFCTTCGVSSFARGVGPKGPMVAINARCVDDIDLDALNVKPFDGKSR